jgi:hypothetical protein
MSQPLDYVTGEMAEVEPSDAATKETEGLPGKITSALPGILGASGLLAATVAIVSVVRAKQRHTRHPVLAELFANSHRWERDVRHHRNALERLERAMQHDGRELEHHRRHALIGLMHR